MHAEGLESLILFVSNLAEARAFYADALELPVVFEDEIAVVLGDATGRLVRSVVLARMRTVPT